MDTKLILFNRELNPDVHFENPLLWTELVGTDWDVFTNSQKGLRKSSGVLSIIKSSVDLVKPFTTYKYVLSVSSSTPGTLDMSIGGTVVSIPNTGVPVIYTGTVTTTASTLYVAFQASALNVTVINYLNLVESPDSYEIDLTEDINVPLNFAISDILDLGRRDTAFSKTITVPGTKTNCKYFRTLYEIERDSDFVPGKKRRAILLSEGEEVFNGIMQLKKVNRLNNGLNNYDLVSFEITLIGNLRSFYSNLGDTLLNELNFSEYDHVYNKTNQFESWYTRIQKNGANYTNWVNGASKTITTATKTATGVKLTFSAAHGFAVGDNIFIDTIGNNNTFYLGDHKVREVVSATEVILFYPFIQFSSTATSYAQTGTAYKHEPTGEGYYYGMVNYGQNNGYSWNVNQMFPLLYLKTIVDKIANKGNRVIDSSFFDSYDFKRIALNYGGDGRLTNTELLARSFRAEYTGIDTLLTVPPDSSYYTAPLDDASTAPNFDGGGTFNLATDKWTVVDSGLYNLLVRFNLHKSTASGTDTGVVVINIYNFTTSTIIANNTILRVTIPTAYSQTSMFSASVLGVSLTQGHVIGIRISNSNAGSASRNVFSNIGTNFSGYITNNFYYEGSIFKMNRAVPKNIKCTDFFDSLIKSFRLVVQPDLTNDNKLIIEPASDFFNTGVDVDMTQMLDTSQKLEIIPMGELNFKKRLYNYKHSSDYLIEDHLKNYGRGYGNKRLIIDNDFINQEYSTELLFAASALQEYPAQTGRIISSITNNIVDPNKTILQDGMRIMYTKVCSNQFNHQWNHVGVSGQTSYNIYPYCGHLDKALGGSDLAFISGPCPTNDLNFDYPIATYFKYSSWTDNNLFNRFHRQEIEQITDKDSNIIRGWFYLKGSFIRKLDFRNRFIVDGHYLRLNKISDWFANKKTPTFCEFVLLKSKPPFVPNYDDIAFGGGLDNGGTVNVLNPPGYATDGGASSNQTGQFNITNSINGQGNIVSGLNVSNITISGNNNTVNQDSSNINIQGNNNFIYGGLTNVNLINTSNTIVTESNSTYINGNKIYQFANILMLMGG